MSFTMIAFLIGGMLGELQLNGANQNLAKICSEMRNDKQFYWQVTVCLGILVNNDKYSAKAKRHNIK